MSDLSEYDDDGPSWSDWFIKRKLPIFAALFLALFIGVLMYNVSQEEEEIIVNKQTQCPDDARHIRDYALVLLDGTDDIVGEYAQSLHEQVRVIARALPRYGRISLHDVATGKKRLFVKCAPKSPDDRDVLKENERRAKASYNKYLDEVDEAVRAFLDDKTRDQSKSPLMYNIADVTALSDFLETDNRSFYIFSDMLENSDGYSHYRDMTPEEFGWLQKHSWYPSYKPKLNDVAVHIFYLLRNKSKRYQSDNHRLLWDNYFNDAGAKHVKWTNVNLQGE